MRFAVYVNLAILSFLKSMRVLTCSLLVLRLICEHIPAHTQYNKSTEAQRLNKVYRGKCIHVFNRLDALKEELVPFYEEKARLAAEERQRSEEITNPKTKTPVEELPQEDELMARLNRLNRASVAKPPPVEVKPKEVKAKEPEPPVEASSEPTKESFADHAEEPVGEEQQDLDFSIFDIKPKAAKSAVGDADDHRLIPDVEVVDPRLDLSWLENDPLFGSKSRPQTSSSSSSSATSSTNSTAASRENTIERHSNDLKAREGSSTPSSFLTPSTHANGSASANRPSLPPPSYESFKKPLAVPSEAPRAVEASFPAPTAKYQVVTVSSEPVPPTPSSPFSLPSSANQDAPEPDFSITRTIRGQQFDPEAMNQRLLNTTVDATCSTFIPLAEGEIPSFHPPKAEAAPSKAAQGQKSSTQLAPVLAGGTPTYAFPPGISSQQQRAAMLSLMGNVPVVFKPNHMNAYDPSRGVVPSLSAATSASSTPTSPTSPHVSSPSTKSGSSKPTGAPPSYGLVTGSSGKKAAPTASSPKAGHKHATPTDKPPAYKKQSSSGAKYTGSSAFPLLTNQRPGAAVNDPSLRSIEMEGDMFDRFVHLTNKNTVRGIETCGILAGSFLPQKNIFRVTHLIIPKQTGTSDTCATTNEDEIFEYQIKHDLLTLGWIHTHPTQACFLSSVDLHTQSSYQALFPEAVAVVIAPRDTPNFAFFHLSKSGFPTIQNCPLSGFHHHPERGLYEACSHVVLSWNSKRPCKVVDMR